MKTYSHSYQLDSFIKIHIPQKFLHTYIKFDTLDHSTNLLILHSYRWTSSIASSTSWTMEESSSLSVIWTNYWNSLSARTPNSLEPTSTISKEENYSG